MPARYIIVALWALALFCLAIALTFSAGAETRSEWFKSLRVPGLPSTSCCDEADCKADDRAYFDQAAGRWMANVNGTMTPVPPDRILTDRASWDGRAYACVWNGRILCFVRPGGGY